MDARKKEISDLQTMASQARIDIRNSQRMLSEVVARMDRLGREDEVYDTFGETAVADLREAAQELRRLASQATQGPWKIWGMQVMADQVGDSNVDTAVPVAHTSQTVMGAPRTFDADYICAMQPDVGWALSFALDACAGRIERMLEQGRSDEVFMEIGLVKTARKILRKEES